MLLRHLPSLLALLILLFLEASAQPIPSDVRVTVLPGFIPLKEGFHDGAPRRYSVSAGTEPLETYPDKVFTEQHGSDLAMSQTDYESQPWHNVEAVEGPGEGYL
ncbi:uncharacterized protein EV420DRAFT_386121 [Desarmillaria tabescens]|uniref:Uncharacterized protein n=1 Tax=Armillaria tabescens TaxID=1929756 RepID=A0AA39N4V8_ARMTA|nr:uncharacterized protein EV420DRAFT_386121 [Desarmillaria tabescens]KAK0458236.1 hypothetical protein EV420DRAFT_386121 [Desarmillaria tabescens]